MSSPVATEPALEKKVVAVISPLLTSAGLPSWWEPLFKSCQNPSVFVSPAWLESWLEVYAGDFKGTWVRWESEGGVVGGCLFVTRTNWKWAIPVKTLYLNATGESVRPTPMAEYNDILYIAGYEAAIVIDAAHLLNAQRWSLLNILGYREEALVAGLVSHLPVAGVKIDEKKANFVDLTSLSEVEFAASLVGRGGNHIRRNRRLYEESYGNLEIARAQSLDEAMRFFGELAMLHDARWQKKGENGAFSNKAVVDFHHRLIGRLWPIGGVDLVCVHASGKAIGYLYNFTTENKIYFFQSGFTYEDGVKLSPGLLTHTLCIERYRLKRYSEYDFLAGESQYKRTLAKQDRSLYWAVIYRDTPWPRLLWLARCVKRKVEGLLRPSA